MSTAHATTTRPRVMTRAIVVLAAVSLAVVLNLVVYAVGRTAGGTFVFTRDGTPVVVDAATVAGFSAVPLGIGLLVVAVASGRAPWVARVAVVVAPVLAVATIAIMTLPVDLDTVSTATLATCHLTLAPISILAIRALRPLHA
ncbi:MAG: DUF6069 family protein [Ornithinimicrobium sp.]